MPFIGNKPSAVPLTSADIADGIITSAKIVDATITNSDVASSIITGQTAETSIAGGDSVLIYDDSASALRKMTRTNFVAGVGGTNTPAFFAYKTTSQTISDNTLTKIQFDSELFDSDSAYDNATNYRFTPTAGKYFIFGSVTLYSGSDVGRQIVTIKKNGSNIVYQQLAFTSFYLNQNDGQSLTLSTIDTANGTDYYEIFASQNNTANGNVTVDFNATERYNYFGAYKLIGA
jgi:hypothetical protein